jgi:hypothetical protein
MLDDYVAEQGLQRLDCLKIDVDSFDFEVLQGAVETLQRFDPFVICELNHALARRGTTNVAALEWMCEQGYQETLVLDHDNFVFRRGTSLRDGLKRSEMRVMFGEPYRPSGE